MSSATQAEKKPLLPRGVVDTLAGSFGGMSLVVTGYPFDTIKVHFSVEKKFMNSFSNNLFCLLTNFVTRTYLNYNTL